MAGYPSPEEMIAGITDIRLASLSASPERRTELRRLLEAQGVVRGFEAQFYRQDGSKVWMSINARVVRDASGTVLYYEGTNQDITQRKAAEEASRQAEAKYRSIFENATEGIFQTTPEGGFRSANPALADMLGFPTPEELMASVTDLEHQAYVKPERRQEFKRLIEVQGYVRGFEFEHYCKDGGIIWVSINARAVTGASGARLYYEGTIQDITKRKRAEEALETSCIIQKALLDNIHDPAWLKDLEGRFLACNDSVAKVYGLPPDQILGRTVFDTLPKEAARLKGEDEQVIRSRRPLVVEAPLTDAQGRLRWFETVKSPLLNEAGEVTGTVGISREVTERKWAERLLQTQRDFGTFLSSSIDLNAAGVAVAGDRPAQRRH